MKGKATIPASDLGKFGKAAELTDVNITKAEPVGKNVFLEFNYKTVENAINLGRYLETLPADSKPTPKKDAVAAPAASGGKK